MNEKQNYLILKLTTLVNRFYEHFIIHFFLLNLTSHGYCDTILLGSV